MQKYSAFNQQVGAAAGCANGWCCVRILEDATIIFTEEFVGRRDITTVRAGNRVIYDGRTESNEQHFFACELGTADERECGGRWDQLLCYP